MTIQQTRRQIAVGIISLIIGFGLVTQLRVTAASRYDTESKSETDLTEVINRLDAENRILQRDLNQMQLKLIQDRQLKSTNQDIANQSNSNLNTLKILSSSSPVSGPGVYLVINDKNHYLTGFDLRQLVEELKASGAIAIAINHKRVAMNSYFFRRHGKIFMDGKKISNPYLVEVIGKPDLIYSVLNLPRGIKDKLAALEGVKITLRKSNNISLPGLD
jgi:uncharacterized protein YlxW (UPF0749 family)